MTKDISMPSPTRTAIKPRRSAPRCGVLLLTLVTLGAALPPAPSYAADRAAFELSVKDLAPALTRRSNPIAFLVGAGDWYCAGKPSHGGSWSTQAAVVEFRRTHPGAVASGDDAMALSGTFEQADRLLCP